MICMKRLMIWGGVGAAGAATLAVALAGPRPAALAAVSGARTPVIVELFTSEGCSDCPPADALATRLKKTQPVPGAQVITLGEHVDYWNNGSWSDRFSSHAFSARQQEYAGHFHLDSAYTPQMVVDGRDEFVGSDESRAEQAVADAARAPKADVHLTRAAGDSVRVHIDHFPANASGADSDVLLAVAEDGLHTRVGGGENAGRGLDHSAVVRGLRVIGTIKASPSASFDATVPAPAPGADRNHSQAVVFVQARASRRVLGAASLPLAQ